MSKSEVARLRQELEASANAAWMGIHGLAEVGRHITITKRMEHMTQSMQALVDVVGEEQAMQIWIEVEDQLEEGLVANPSEIPGQDGMSSYPQPIKQEEGGKDIGGTVPSH